MRLKANLTADAALLITNLIWGTTFVIVKDILEYWPPITYLMFRMVLAALILIVIFSKELKWMCWNEVKVGFWLGVILGAGYAGQAVGQVYTTPTKSAFITGLATPLVPVVSFLFLRLRPSGGGLIGVILASIGGALMFAPHTEKGVNIGDLITLGCAIMFAMHISLVCQYAKQQDIRRLTALQISATAIFLIIFWLGIQVYISLLGGSGENSIIAGEARPLLWNVRTIWEIIYLAIVGTVVTFLLWTWGQARRSPTHVAIMFSLHPVFAALIAIGVRGIGEWMGTRASIGAALIFVSVIITQIRWNSGRHNSRDNS